MNRRTTLVPVAVALYLAGCGGGGGGGVSSGINAPLQTPNIQAANPVPPVSGAEAFRTAEYNRMGALDAVRAADAYALGYTGLGVLVGIVDFNFSLGSSEVDFHPDSVGLDPQWVALYEAQTGQTESGNEHGFAIAATVAARKNDSGIHGIAFDARVLAVDYFSGVNESQLVQGGVLYHTSDPWTYITSRGARIVNVSFGYDTGDAIGGAPQVDEVYLLDSPTVAVANGALLVLSAGNGAGPNPSLYNLDTLADLGAAGILDSGPGAYIVAGAVDANNEIASFSNRAGVAANYYMVAPGVSLVVPWDGGLALLSGTSFAAPLISGAAAIVLQHWPNLTARQVADILFASATDLGAPGVDTTYGHGLLNLATALQPMGVSTLAVADGGAPAVGATGLVLGPAFGDAPAFHSALSEVMMLDGFGRDFAIDLSRVAVARPNLPDLFGTMEQRLGWRHTGFRNGSDFSLGYSVRRNPEDGIVPFQALAGPRDYSTHQTLFRFSGVGSGFDWAAGTGLSLRDGMAGADSAFSALSLTNPFSPMVGAAPGMFASLSVPLDQGTRLSFGASHAGNQGLTGPGFNPGLRTPFNNSAEAASLRLDHDTGSSLVSFELGSVLETGGFMGALAAGGLKMAERASTTWAAATAETGLDSHWSLKSAFTMAASGATHPQGSLIASIGPVYATSFALGLSGTNLFRADDVLSFTFGQPLRAERAGVTLVTGVARDLATGGVIMGKTHSALTPSGREFDFETGYRFLFYGWNAAANVAYALDANHVKDRHAVLALFTLSRAF